mmetsp:Transcript_19837/g.49626  ORF Transcript_19837/g.49626 Transcript_19837/m.49626 type:complete len:264 (+) Transcript_19837:90-881(+)
MPAPQGPGHGHACRLCRKDDHPGEPRQVPAGEGNVAGGRRRAGEHGRHPPLQGGRPEPRDAQDAGRVRRGVRGAAGGAGEGQGGDEQGVLAARAVDLRDQARKHQGRGGHGPDAPPHHRRAAHPHRAEPQQRGVPARGGGGAGERAAEGQPVPLHRPRLCGQEGQAGGPAQLRAGHPAVQQGAGQGRERAGRQDQGRVGAGAGAGGQRDEPAGRRREDCGRHAGSHQLRAQERGEGDHLQAPAAAAARRAGVQAAVHRVPPEL